MSDLRTILIGYISGYITGVLIIIIIGSYIYISETDATVPEAVKEIMNDVMTIYEANENLFMISFIFGFLSGIGTLTTAKD